MSADNEMARVAIMLSHPDRDIQLLFMEQFEQMKTYLHNTLGEQWIWDVEAYDHLGRPTSMIYKELDQVNVLDKDSWSRLITFFKPRIISLDEFWSMAFDTFDDLQN